VDDAVPSSSIVLTLIRDKDHHMHGFTCVFRKWVLFQETNPWLESHDDLRNKLVTYSRRLLTEQTDRDVSQCRVDQDSLGNVMEVSWNGGLSSRDLRFAVWQRCESRCLAAAVAHDFLFGVCFGIRL
jgi:hypothetical protein